MKKFLLICALVLGATSFGAAAQHHDRNDRNWDQRSEHRYDRDRNGRYDRRDYRTDQRYDRYDRRYDRDRYNRYDRYDNRRPVIVYRPAPPVYVPPRNAYYGNGYYGVPQYYNGPRYVQHRGRYYDQ